MCAMMKFLTNTKWVFAVKQDVRFFGGGSLVDTGTSYNERRSPMIQSPIALYTAVLFILLSVCPVQAYISTCASDCQSRIKLELTAAEQLENQQQYEAAALQYEAIIAEEPFSI